MLPAAKSQELTAAAMGARTLRLHGSFGPPIVAAFEARLAGARRPRVALAEATRLIKLLPHIPGMGEGSTVAAAVFNRLLDEANHISITTLVGLGAGRGWARQGGDVPGCLGARRCCMLRLCLSNPSPAAPGRHVVRSPEDQLPADTRPAAGAACLLPSCAAAGPVRCTTLTMHPRAVAHACPAAPPQHLLACVERNLWGNRGAQVQSVLRSLQMMGRQCGDGEQSRAGRQQSGSESWCLGPCLEARIRRTAWRLHLPITSLCRHHEP